MSCECACAVNAVEVRESVRRPKEEQETEGTVIYTQSFQIRELKTKN
jgi:hypothetical protein